MTPSNSHSGVRVVGIFVTATALVYIATWLQPALFSPHTGVILLLLTSVLAAVTVGITANSA